MPNEDDIATTRSSISNATSYEEIGEFWDNHSLDEYWEETLPVEFKVNLHSTVTYYGIDESLSEQIRILAQRRGMSPTKLLTLWVEEKLQEEMA